MALNKDVLGTNLYNAMSAFNNTPIAPEDMETARENFCKALADEVIKHFKTAGVINVTVSTTGTATAQTGTGTGTIA